MSEVRALFGQFLEIQKKQNELLMGIAQNENLQHFREHALERCMHMRDYHGGSIDPWLIIESRAVTERGLADLNQQYKQNQQRLEELHKQLFAEVF